MSEADGHSKRRGVTKAILRFNLWLFYFFSVAGACGVFPGLAKILESRSGSGEIKLGLLAGARAPGGAGGPLVRMPRRAEPGLP